MNRNLLLFSLFLIVLGLGFGIYLVSVFGILMLIPALMSTSKPPPRPGSSSAPSPPQQERRRIIPPTPPQPMAAPPKAETQPQSMMTSPTQSQSMMVTPTPQSSAYQSYSPALFPNSMFSYLAPSGSTPAMPTNAPGKKEPERDELIEAGAMLAILRLLIG